MKVLIGAYACEPGAGSEPGAGWAWTRAAALDHDVWLLTRKNNASAIEQALAKEPQLRLHPVYIDLPAWARFWKKGGRGVHLYYLLWQALAWRVARRLHRDVRFDVAHHLTFATDWLPAAVVWIPGLPAIWGPVGGATGTPWRLWRWLGWRGIFQEAVREVTTRPLRRIFGDPTAKRAALIVAQNWDVERRFKKRGTVVVEPNVALDPDDLDVHVERAPEEAGKEGRRAVFAGRIIPLKGLRLAIAAIAHPSAVDWTLDVYGDGPDRRACERLAERLGVGGRVRFHGKRPRGEIFQALAGAQALLLPSVHDAAGWAVAEALALGAPVVCLDRGGPAVLVEDGKTGTKVRGTRDVTPRLASALVRVDATGRNKFWTDSRVTPTVTAWYGEVRGKLSSDPVTPEATLLHGRDDGAS